MSSPVWTYLNVIHTFHRYCIGVELGALVGGTNPAGAAYPIANDAIFIPMRIVQNVWIKRLYSVNGSTASGNIDVGIYTEDGARLRSSGSTAQSGTSQPQFFDITDIMLSPGRYYLAVAKNDTTGTLFRTNTSVLHQQKMGLLKMASAMALPATATFATVTDAFVPMIGAEIFEIK